MGRILASQFRVRDLAIGRESRLQCSLDQQICAQTPCPFSGTWKEQRREAGDRSVGEFDLPIHTSLMKLRKVERTQFPGSFEWHRACE